MSIFQKINFENYQELVEILGEKNQFVLNDFSFSLSNGFDQHLSKNIVEANAIIQKISNLLKCSPEDVPFSFDFENSDHRDVTHTLSLNNNRQIGSYCKIKSELFIIKDYKDQLFSLESVEDNRIIQANTFNIQPVSWDSVFMIRDDVSCDVVYDLFS